MQDSSEKQHVDDITEPESGASKKEGFSILNNPSLIDREIPIKEEVVVLDKLSKFFGNTKAVNRLSFTLDRGDILGFLGPNGAGKTTTLKMLTTLIAPSEGSAKVDGFSLDEVRSVRNTVGYMPDFLGVYDELTVTEYLEFFGRAYKLNPETRSFAIQESMAVTNITSLKDHGVESLSRGQKQRLALARILLHNPSVLLMDEPAAGLDPKARVEFRNILKSLQKDGKTMIVSSHVLSEVADFCNKIAIIWNGELVAFGNTDELLSRLNESRIFLVKSLDRTEELREFLTTYPGVQSVTYEGEQLKIDFPASNKEVQGLLQRCIEEGYPIVNFAERKGNLEELYLKFANELETRA